MTSVHVCRCREGGHRVPGRRTVTRREEALERPEAREQQREESGGPEEPGGGEDLTSEQRGREAEWARRPFPWSSLPWSPPPGPLSSSSCLAPELQRSLASSSWALGRPNSGLFTELLWSGPGSWESSVPERSPEAGASTRLGQLLTMGKVLVAAANCLHGCRCAVTCPHPQLPGATPSSRRRAVTLKK